MKRGDVVVVRGKAGAATKPRPCVVVQRSVTLPGATKMTACPLSSTIRLENPVRITVAPSADNGLRRASQVEVDWIFTEREDRFDAVIGALDGTTMLAIDQALRLWLDL